MSTAYTTDQFGRCILRWERYDGGRAAAGYTGKAGDCAARAIAIACAMPYQAAYDLVNEHGARERSSKRRRGKSTARDGVHRATMRRIMDALGWSWTPTMGIGTGCRVHLRADELPAGRMIVALSRHYAAVVDGVLLDTHDCSRESTRCVYGYWTKEDRS